MNTQQQLVEYRIVDGHGNILAVAFDRVDADVTRKQLERHLGERLFVDTAREARS